MFFELIMINTLENLIYKINKRIKEKKLYIQCDFIWQAQRLINKILGSACIVITGILRLSRRQSFSLIVVIQKWLQQMSFFGRVFWLSHCSYHSIKSSFTKPHLHLIVFRGFVHLYISLSHYFILFIIIFSSQFNGNCHQENYWYFTSPENIQLQKNEIFFNQVILSLLLQYVGLN